MGNSLLKFLFIILFSACNRLDTDVAEIYLLKVSIGEQEINTSGLTTGDLPVDRPITLTFSRPVDPGSVPDAIGLYENDHLVQFSISILSDNKTVIIFPTGTLNFNRNYRLVITEKLKSFNGGNFLAQDFRFKTLVGSLKIEAFTIESAEYTSSGRIVNVPLEFQIYIDFSEPVDPESLKKSCKLTGPEAPELQYSFNEDNSSVNISGTAPLKYLSPYKFEISDALTGADGGDFSEISKTFYTELDETNKFPVISEEELLTRVQEQTFKYFWDFAEPNSGLARERNTSGNLVTIGGSGFGIMAIIVGIERGFISRQQGIERWTKMLDFLSAADRFHGVWPHWLNGITGKTIPFSAFDNGGDLVETAFMIQGLLTVKAYLNENVPEEKSIIDKITLLWHEVEWNWYTRGGQDVLYWHWSPDYNWNMNLRISGYNECLITYVLAAASPTYPIDKQVYDAGWARQGVIVNGKQYYQHTLPLGKDFGGPLFFAHYSYLGLDPRNLSDQYAYYWEQNRNHTLINRAHCIVNPLGYVGYAENCWGLTASDNHQGYRAHSPTNDLGVITPTAALSSFPYTPEESMEALEFFYYTIGDRLWGEYGFHDAFNLTEGWIADSYLAIDQGPIILMIENHRTGLLWDLFMKDQEVLEGLRKLNFTYNK